MENIRAIVATVKTLSATDPMNPDVVALVDELVSLVNGPSTVASDVDLDFVYRQIKKLHQAAEIPTKNYGRILAISASLGRAVQIARRPQNAAIRPKLASLVAKVAGLFAEVDTVEDLDKPLEQIEKAVHALYGDQNDPHTYNFVERGKGHHSR